MDARRLSHCLIAALVVAPVVPGHAGVTAVAAPFRRFEEYTRRPIARRSGTNGGGDAIGGVGGDAAASVESDGDDGHGRGGSGGGGDSGGGGSVEGEGGGGGERRVGASAKLSSEFAPDDPEEYFAPRLLTATPSPTVSAVADKCEKRIDSHKSMMFWSLFGIFVLGCCGGVCVTSTVWFFCWFCRGTMEWPPAWFQRLTAKTYVLSARCAPPLNSPLTGHSPSSCPNGSPTRSPMALALNCPRVRGTHGATQRDLAPRSISTATTPITGGRCARWRWRKSQAPCGTEASVVEGEAVEGARSERAGAAVATRARSRG